jgi:hypothetical protein
MLNMTNLETSRAELALSICQDAHCSYTDARKYAQTLQLGASRDEYVKIYKKGLEHMTALQQIDKATSEEELKAIAGRLQYATQEICKRIRDRVKYLEDLAKLPFEVDMIEETFLRR